MNTETLTAMTGTASLVKCDIISRPPDIFVSPRWIFILVFLICLTLGGSAEAYTVSGNTYTTNGSQSDVQAACSAAPDNGTVTVVIPNGSYSWSGTLTISSSLTLAGQSAGGVTITDQNASGNMIAATSSANGYLNIYWLNVVMPSVNSSSPSFPLVCDRTEPSSYTVMIHDCKFNNAASGAAGYDVKCLANGIIFWNDTFIGDGVDAENGQGGSITGIEFVCDKYGYTYSWNTPDTLGSADRTGLSNSYVENCTFYDGTECCSNFDDNSRVVWRYDTMNNAALGSHGQETSAYGARHWEAYNDTFNYSASGTSISGATYPLNMNYWFIIRGGTGVVTASSIQDIPYNKTGFILNVFSITRGMNDGSGGSFCPIAYPAPHQTGWGWSVGSSSYWGIGDDSNTSVLVGGTSPGAFAPDGTGATLDPLYIWGNSGTETSDPNYVATQTYFPDDCGDGESIGTYLQQNRDYYVNVADPSWTPYTYPHPLHTRYALASAAPTPTSATPAAPQNLRVIQ
jgi:hypothetical protein